MQTSYQKVQSMVKCILEFCPNIGNIYTRKCGNMISMKISFTRVAQNNYENFFYVFDIGEEGSFDEAEHLGNILRRYDSYIKH